MLQMLQEVMSPVMLCQQIFLFFFSVSTKGLLFFGVIVVFTHRLEDVASDMMHVPVGPAYVQRGCKYYSIDYSADESSSRIRNITRSAIIFN